GAGDGPGIRRVGHDGGERAVEVAEQGGAARVGGDEGAEVLRCRAGHGQDTLPTLSVPSTTTTLAPLVSTPSSVAVSAWATCSGGMPSTAATEAASGA